MLTKMDHLKAVGGLSGRSNTSLGGIDILPGKNTLRRLQETSNLESRGVTTIGYRFSSIRSKK